MLVWGGGVLPVPSSGLHHFSPTHALPYYNVLNNHFYLMHVLETGSKLFFSLSDLCTPSDFLRELFDVVDIYHWQQLKYMYDKTLYLVKIVQYDQF